MADEDVRNEHDRSRVYPPAGGARPKPLHASATHGIADGASAGRTTEREAMIARHLGLARHLALRYSDSGEPLDDLFQVAALGLVNAVDRYDPTRGASFSTFAVPTILGELKRHFRDRGWAIHVPRDLKDAAVRVKQTIARHEGGRAPTTVELAEATGLSLEMVLEALEVAGVQRTLSLDAPVGDDEDAGTALIDVLGVDDGELARAQDRTLLSALMRSVTPREREILRLRFAEDLTQSEIGERVGISQMQVSRVLRSALARLRTAAQSGEAEVV